MSRIASPDFVRSCAVRALAALRFEGAPLHVIGERQTLRALRDRRASLARYGDGELEIMIGGGIRFQEYDPRLAKRLREVLRAPSEKFLVGVPNFRALQIKTLSRRKSWERYRRMFSHLVRRGAEYHSAFVSRPAGIVGLESAEYFEDFKSLWRARDVVLIHNDAATARHPLFEDAARVRHLSCPPTNAFREYDSLFEHAAQLADEPEALVLIAAGPTAGVLAWDLTQRGVQALDIGHLTNTYDEFLRKT